MAFAFVSSLKNLSFSILERWIIDNGRNYTPEAPFSAGSNMQNIPPAAFLVCHLFAEFSVPQTDSTCSSEVVCCVLFSFCPVFECCDPFFSFYSLLPVILVTRSFFPKGTTSSLHYTDNLQASFIVYLENSKKTPNKWRSRLPSAWIFEGTQDLFKLM